MRTIAEFLIELARNDELRERFERDSRAAVEEFGLSGEKADLLVAGTLRDLRIRIEAEIEVDGETVSFITIWWFLPKSAD